jgi:hypothetical protein
MAMHRQPEALTTAGFLLTGCASVKEYDWLVGVVAGVLASIGGQLLQAHFAARRDRAAHARAVLLERYEKGKKALEQYDEYLEEPPTGIDRLGRDEAWHFEQQLADVFGPKFAAKAAWDSHEQAGRSAEIKVRIQAMHDQLAKWERELGYPKRVDLGE